MKPSLVEVWPITGVWGRGWLRFPSVDICAHGGLGVKFKMGK